MGVYWILDGINVRAINVISIRTDALLFIWHETITDKIVKFAEFENIKLIKFERNGKNTA